MKLRLKDIGIVHLAELELNGLTVIAGENGIGKSAIGKALYCALQSGVNVEKKIEERLMPGFILEVLNNLIKNNPDASSIISSMTGTLINELNNKQSNIIDVLTQTIEQSELTKNEETQKLIQELIEKQEPQTNITFGEAKQRLHDDLIQSVFQNSYNNKLEKEKKAVLEFSKEQQLITKIEVEYNKTTIANFTEDIFSDILLIETPTILSLFRYIKENLAFNNNQNKLLPNYIKDLIQKLSESSYAPNYDKPLCQRIQQIIKGRVLIENEQLFYEEDNKTRHAIVNVATGIKSLGMLQLLIAGDVIVPGSFLVVDEPEVHLHPSWQLDYARIIVELVKSGVEVLVTSHSSYFIEALNVYTKNEQIAEKCHIYLGEMTANGSVFKDVTEDLEPIFAAFAEPMIQLMIEENRGKRKKKRNIPQAMVQEPKAPYKTKDSLDKSV